MNDKATVVGGVDHALEAFAAELTAAVYPVALRHAGRRDKWLDLELDIWRALSETVKKWGAGSATRRMTL
jgi:hypothetical protein